MGLRSRIAVTAEELDWGKFRRDRTCSYRRQLVNFVDNMSGVTIHLPPGLRTLMPHQMLTKVTWTFLRRAAVAILPKASIGLALVYLVFYLKRGGFETAPLEITLAGSLLLLLSCAAIHAAVPRLVSRFEDEYKYETYLHKLVADKHLSLAHCCSPFILQASNPTEASELEFTFDSKFGYSLEDLKAALGETGIVTYIARATFLRTNLSRNLLRLSLSAGLLLGLALMYWKPLYMIYYIYAGQQQTG